MYENKVIIMGRLTRKPELKEFNGGQLVSLNIAINSVWFDKDTQTKKENTEFVSVTVFGKQAGNCAEYLEKGQCVYVEGKIKNRVEETDQGNRYHTGIMAERVQFGAKAGGGDTNYQPREKTPYTPKNETHKASNSLDKIEYPNDNINVDDIPF